MTSTDTIATKLAEIATLQKTSAALNEAMRAARAARAIARAAAVAEDTDAAWQALRAAEESTWRLQVKTDANLDALGALDREIATLRAAQ